MPPANDNLANATVISGASGGIAFDLTGATSEVGEPANNGSTIWFLWRNTVKTNVTNSPYNTLAGTTVTFGTRWRPSQAQPTMIPVVVTAYKALNTGDAPPYAFGDLTFLAQGKTFGWSQQGQVTVDALAALKTVGGVPTVVGDMIAIRVDVWPSGTQGKGTLWWEQWSENVPFPCNSSVNADGDDDGNCLSVVRVATNAYTSVVYPSSGNAPAGLYVMRYRGGIMTYDSAVASAEDGVPHWVVGKLPPLTDQTWTPGNPAPLVTGYFWSWQYANSGTQYGHFDEPNMSGQYGDDWGYWTPRLAAQAVGCMRTTFQHDGTSPITMLYTDKDFADDGPSSNGSPLFVLSKAVPKWVPLYVCSTKVSSGVYDVTFKLQNNNWYSWPNVTITALLTGGISASNTIGPQTIGNLGTVSFTLRLTLASPTDRNQTATVQFSDSSGVIATLSWSLAPYIVQTAAASQSPCNLSWGHGTSISFDVRGLMTDALTAVIGTGINSDLASFANGACVTGGSYSFGAVGCNYGLSISFTPKAGTVPPYNFPVTWGDTYATIPATIFHT